MRLWRGCGDEKWNGLGKNIYQSGRYKRPIVGSLALVFINITLARALNPKTYGRARVLEAASCPILALVGSRP